MDDFLEILCPYCGEPTEAHSDQVDVSEDFVEDCVVCCRPIAFHIHRDVDGSLVVTGRRESD